MRLSLIVESLEDALLTRLKQLIVAPVTDFGYEVEFETEEPRMKGSEARIIVKTAPTKNDPTGLFEIVGWINAYIDIRTEADGIYAYAVCENFAGDDEPLIGKSSFKYANVDKWLNREVSSPIDPNRTTSMVKISLEEISNKVNARFQEWASDLQQTKNDPKLFKSLLDHFNLTDEVRDFLGE